MDTVMLSVCVCLCAFSKLINSCHCGKTETVEDDETDSNENEMNEHNDKIFSGRFARISNYIEWLY